jgi:hypothetical protein
MAAQFLRTEAAGRKIVVGSGMRFKAQSTRGEKNEKNTEK